MCVTCIFDVPILEQKRLKTVKIKHFPDKDIVYNHAYKVFQENEEELNKLFDCENLMRECARDNPKWVPPPEAGRYSKKVYALLNQIANETILEEERVIDLSRSRSAVSPFAREIRNDFVQLSNKFLQSKI